MCECEHIVHFLRTVCFAPVHITRARTHRVWVRADEISVCVCILHFSNASLHFFRFFRYSVDWKWNKIHLPFVAIISYFSFRCFIVEFVADACVAPCAVQPTFLRSRRTLLFIFLFSRLFRASQCMARVCVFASTCFSILHSHSQSNLPIHLHISTHVSFDEITENPKKRKIYFKPCPIKLHSPILTHPARTNWMRSGHTMGII